MYHSFDKLDRFPRINCNLVKMNKMLVTKAIFFPMEEKIKKVQNNSKTEI